MYTYVCEQQQQKQLGGHTVRTCRGPPTHGGNGGEEEPAPALPPHLPPIFHSYPLVPPPTHPSPSLPSCSPSQPSLLCPPSPSSSSPITSLPLPHPPIHPTPLPPSHPFLSSSLSSFLPTRPFLPPYLLSPYLPDTLPPTHPPTFPLSLSLSLFIPLSQSLFPFSPIPLTSNPPSFLVHTPSPLPLYLHTHTRTHAHPPSTHRHAHNSSIHPSIYFLAYYLLHTNTRKPRKLL